LNENSGRHKRSSRADDPRQHIWVQVMARSIAHSTVEVTLREEAGAVRLLVSGDLDRDNAWALTAAVIRSEVTQPSRLVVDLQRLTFVDVGGLRAISDAARRARRHGCGFAVANPSEPVERLLRLTGLDRALDVVASGRGER
jgi:anti-anti-sigma factor